MDSDQPNPPGSRNVVLVGLDLGALGDLMRLPQGLRIVHAQYSLERQQLELMIEGPGLPLTRSGQPLMRAEVWIDERPRLSVLRMGALVIA